VRRIASERPETELLEKILGFSKKHSCSQRVLEVSRRYPAIAQFPSLRSLGTDQTNCYIFGLIPDERGGKYASFGSTVIFTGMLVRDVLDEQATEVEVSVKLLKIARYDGRDDLLRRLDRQVDLWKSFDHENILPFLGLFTPSLSHDEFYLVSEYAKHGNVSEFLIQGDNRSQWAFDMVQVVVSGMRYLHGCEKIQRSGAITKNAGYFHGDLKPTNVLVQEINNRYVAQIADFDYAGDRTSGGTLPTRESTACYVAPELLARPLPQDDKEVRREMFVKGDIYSLGLTVYEIMTGKTPFEEVRVGALSLAGLFYEARKDVSIFEKYSPKEEGRMSGGIYEVFGRCWCWNPSERPSMEEVAEAYSQTEI